MEAEWGEGFLFPIMFVSHCLAFSDLPFVFAFLAWFLRHIGGWMLRQESRWNACHSGSDYLRCITPYDGVEDCLRSIAKEGYTFVST